MESVLQAIFELDNYGLILRLAPGREEGYALLDHDYIAPNDMNLSEFGNRFYNVLNLDEIQSNDILEVATYIS